MPNRIKDTFHSVPLGPQPHQPKKKKEIETLNQRMQVAAHESLNFDEVDIPLGNAEIVNAPGLLVQGKIIKDIKRELAFFKDLLEKKEEQLAAIGTSTYHPETQALAADVELCNQKIRDLEYQLQEMKMLAARIGAGTGESALLLSSSIHQYLQDGSNAFAPAVMLGSVAVPFTEALHLFKQKNRYKELGRELKGLRILHSKATGAKKIEYEKKIEIVEKQRKQSANSLMEGMAKTASSLANSSNDALHALSELAPSLISETVLAGTSAAASVAGFINAGVSARELSKRVKESGAIEAEIDIIRRKITQSTSPIKEILNMRLKSLLFQKMNNQVSSAKSGMSLTAGVTGSSAGLVGLTSLATAGAVGVTVATAGIAAIVLGSLAAGLGVSNLIYTNRHVIKNKGEDLHNQIDRKILKQHLKNTAQKVEKRATEWTALQSKKKHAEETAKIFDALLPFQDEINILEKTHDHLKKLETNLQVIRQEVDSSRSPELATSLSDEIDHLKGLMKDNKSERKQLEEKMFSLIQIINAEAEQYKNTKHAIPAKIKSSEEAMHKLMDKTDTLEKRVKVLKAEGTEIKKAKTVAILKDRLQDTSQKEIESFLVFLQNQFNQEKSKNRIARFLNKEDTAILGGDVYQGVMEYLLKKVSP